MSILTATTINTANATTPLTATSGNTLGPSVIVSSGTDVVIKANTTANVFIANSAGIRANAAVTVANTLNVTGLATINTSTFTGNATFVNLAATLVNTTSAGVSSNTLSLGTSSIASSGYSRLPNGLLMHWGTIAGVTTAGATINFSPGFSGQPFTVMITPKALVYGTITSTTSSSAAIDSSGTSDYYYLAIGLGG